MGNPAWETVCECGELTRMPDAETRWLIAQKEGLICHSHSGCFWAGPIYRHGSKPRTFQEIAKRKHWTASHGWHDGDMQIAWDAAIASMTGRGRKRTLANGPPHAR